MRIVERVTTGPWYVHVTFLGSRRNGKKFASFVVGSVMSDPGDPIMKDYLDWWREYDDKT